MVKKERRRFQKKVKLAKHGRRTKWAPFWAVVKKYGKGKRVHPSYMTRIKRSWRRTKLRVKPYTDRRRQFGD
jgi:ribosomal protein L39E